MFFFSEGFTFRNFLADAFAVFMFVLWFWLLIIVIGDLFRRRDISGWIKAIWVIALIVFPYLGIFAYMITQSRGMAERSSQQAQQSRDELRRVIGFSVADEIEKLDRLKKIGVDHRPGVRSTARQAGFVINVVIPLSPLRLWSWRIGLPDQVQGHLNKHGKRAGGAERDPEPLPAPGPQSGSDCCHHRGTKGCGVIQKTATYRARAEVGTYWND
ncbi:MAG TPA: PLD nuclease N-terminal domain-containing protein [Pseudolabrys sp.]|nr:PLD nuclease N-terminal domain-containing protein [Pseudolabrys sp.]